MSEPTVLPTPLNVDMAWTITAKDSSGNVVAFSASDALEAIVWQGSDSASLFAPTPTWISAPAGTIKLSVGHAQTSALTPGVYPLEVSVIPNGTTQRLRVLDAWLALTSSPGSSTLPAVYCSYADLTYAGGGSWLDLIRQREGLANFTKERAMARAWLDTLIIKKFRPWEPYRGDGSTWSLTSAVDARNPTLLGYLTSNYLLVTDDIKQITALKSLELICRSRLTFEKGDTFASRASYFKRLCDNRTLCTTAEIDSNADGYADYTFNLGTISTR